MADKVKDEAPEVVATEAAEAPATPADEGATIGDLADLGDAMSSAPGADTVDVAAAPIEPEIDAQGRAYATGKRKNAVARVWIKPGSGKNHTSTKLLRLFFRGNNDGVT